MSAEAATAPVAEKSGCVRLRQRPRGTIRAEDLELSTEPLPVSTLDALEAGILALSMDEARRKKSVIDLRPIWDRFDEALHSRAA